MAEAVGDGGATDGVGIGRPAAAEPDIARKLLDGHARSALVNVLEGNFSLSNLAANTQMWQAGRHSMTESNGDPAANILDMTADDAAVDYLKALKAYVEQLEADGLAGRVTHGVLEYEPQSR